MSAFSLKVLAHMLWGRKFKKLIFRGPNKEMKVSCLIVFVKIRQLIVRAGLVHDFFNTVVILEFITSHSNFISYFSHRSDNTICSLQFFFFLFFFFSPAEQEGNGQRKEESISVSCVNI